MTRAEESLPIEEMVLDAVAASVVEDFEFPVLTYPASRGVGNQT